MLKALGLSGAVQRILRRLLYFWVKTRILPEDLTNLGLDPAKPVLYVLQWRFLSNALVLSHEVAQAGLPPAWQSLHAGGWSWPRAFCFLAANRNTRNQRDNYYPPLLASLVTHALQQPDSEVQIVPLTIFWGRAPDSQNSILKLLFADGWSPRGGLRQFFTILLHGKHTLLRFGAPLSLQTFLQAERERGATPVLALRKLTRVLRVHFRRQREAAIGPDLSHRRTQIDALLDAPAVVAAISADAQENGNNAAAFARARDNARKYAWEIASDYSYPVVLIMERLMSWLWNRIYNGIEIHHMDSVTAAAPGAGIVYVPCHRSHIDYLLMSYILYRNGMMPPHIAAGANLNLPLVGPILRKCGAFFLRRSFKGNKVYSAVFNEYLHMMIARGYSIEYFVEGGRSRSGRLLAPMAGMLSMTLHSYLRDSERPLLFIPVYIGYEKLFEGRTYVGELMGKPKQKENLLDLLLTLRELKKNFGKVHVNFGAPMALESVLDQAHPAWREDAKVLDKRAPWVLQSVDKLSRAIADGINSAAVATAVNLLSLALLTTPKQAMDEKRLANLLNALRSLLQALPYSERTMVTELDGQAMIAYCEELKLLARAPHPLGDILYFMPEEAVLASYARNNVLHLFALPALLACLFMLNSSLTYAHLLRLVQALYPFLRAELFLRWAPEEVEAALQQYLSVLLQQAWLQEAEGVYYAPDPHTDAYAQLGLLAQAVRPSLLRYFITLALLRNNGSACITPAELEGLCHLQAQRLSMVREFNAPEFFDKVIFRSLIATLGAQGIASVNQEDGKLHFDQRLLDLSNDARHVLPADVRQAITHLAGADAQDALNVVRQQLAQKKTA
ncbi:glycerol-3-phosphate 1-O-acyltransferase PlsB [Massilia sp. W12]|uniref:glycerol-3-phosphate 1-O-acyltransferase PlsB n=1 Tax=Massilia sp. W12 TaxID=3126507 RepID=UPI0030D47F69